MRDSLKLEDLQAYVQEKRQLNKLRIPKWMWGIAIIAIVWSSFRLTFPSWIALVSAVVFVGFGISSILDAKRRLPPFFRARKILAGVLPDDQIHRIVYDSVRHKVVVLLIMVALVLPFLVSSPFVSIPSLQLMTFPIAIIGFLWLGWRSITNWQALQPHDKQETRRFYQFDIIRLAILIFSWILSVYFMTFIWLLIGVIVCSITSSSMRWRVSNWIITQVIWNEFKRTGDNVKALNRLRTIQKFLPHQLEVRMTNAAILYHAGYYEEAEATYKDILVRRQQNGANVLAFIIGRMAVCADVQSEEDNALKYWEAAIEIEPDNYLRYGDLAEFYLQQQIEQQRALELIEHEIQNLKGVPATERALYSWALAAIGKIDAAQAQIKLIPPDLDSTLEKQYIYYCLGWTYYHLGNSNSAKASFDKAITIDSYSKVYSHKAKQTLEILGL